MERSKRRGSVLRREALERLRQGTAGPALDGNDSGLLDGGGRRVSIGETRKSVMRFFDFQR